MTSPRQVYTISVMDYDKELSPISVNVPVLTAENFAAQELLRLDFRANALGMTLGALHKETLSRVQIYSLVPQVGPQAKRSQRELKWRVIYHDTANGVFNMTLPCADTSLLNPNNRPHAGDGPGGYVEYFINSMQAYALSPNGLPITIDDIILVGRAV